MHLSSSTSLEEAMPKKVSGMPNSIANLIEGISFFFLVNFKPLGLPYSGVGKGYFSYAPRNKF